MLFSKCLLCILTFSILGFSPVGFSQKNDHALFTNYLYKRSFSTRGTVHDHHNIGLGYQVTQKHLGLGVNMYFHQHKGQYFSSAETIRHGYDNIANYYTHEVSTANLDYAYLSCIPHIEYVHKITLSNSQLRHRIGLYAGFEGLLYFRTYNHLKYVKAYQVWNNTDDGDYSVSSLDEVNASAQYFYSLAGCMYQLQLCRNHLVLGLQAQFGVNESSHITSTENFQNPHSGRLHYSLGISVGYLFDEWRSDKQNQ